MLTHEIEMILAETAVFGSFMLIFMTLTRLGPPTEGRSQLIGLHNKKIQKPTDEPKSSENIERRSSESWTLKRWKPGNTFSKGYMGWRQKTHRSQTISDQRISSGMNKTSRPLCFPSKGKNLCTHKQFPFVKKQEGEDFLTSSKGHLHASVSDNPIPRLRVNFKRKKNWIKLEFEAWPTGKHGFEKLVDCVSGEKAITSTKSPSARRRLGCQR